MAPSSRDTPTSSSPDHVHPCQVDDSDWSEEVIVRRKLGALLSIGIGLPVLCVGFLVLAAVERWRAWRSGAYGKTEAD
jgi:hypothetical protein